MLMDFQARHIEVDQNGYLIDINDWTRELAGHMAGMEGIPMTEANWEVVNILRDYYLVYQIAPIIKILAKEMQKVMGEEKGNMRYLFELYPDGPAKQACKIAGLPKPTGCI